MGWMASWIAVQTTANAAVLDHLGLVETGAGVFPGSRVAPFSYREFPDNWLIIFSERFDWADEKRLLDISSFGLALACQFEDKVDMTCSLTAALSGARLWRVFHNSVDTISKLEVDGDPPSTWGPLRDAVVREQEQAGGEGAGVDIIWEAPVRLAKAICGYRADEDEASFRALRRGGESIAGASEGRRTLLDKLLGRLWPRRDRAG